MKKTLICYTGKSASYVKWVEAGQPDDPTLLPFRMHKGADKGDRYLIYVGGDIDAFVGYGVVQTGWRQGRTKRWLGKQHVFVDEHRLREPVPGEDVTTAAGLVRPRRSLVVDPSIAATVWRSARGKPLTSVERAVEGGATEARSRKRNAALRQAAMAKANGVCVACRQDFRQVAGGLGRRCLVVHHTKQLSDTDQPEERLLSDLVVVCANCHMLIHSNSQKALTVSQVRSKLKTKVAR